MKFRLTTLATLVVIGLAGCDDPKSAQGEKPAPVQTAQAPAAPAAPQDAPPLESGVHVERNTCPGEGCTFEFYWRATAPVPLRERADDKAAIVATVAQKENVEAVKGDYYVTPVRGQATRDLNGLIDADNNDVGMKKGEVIYLLGDAGEGTFNVLYKGKPASTSLDFPLDALTLDTDIRERPESVWWVQLKRANGQTGWVRDPKDFDCKNYHSGDTGCVAVKKTP